MKTRPRSRSALLLSIAASFSLGASLLAQNGGEEAAGSAQANPSGRRWQDDELGELLSKTNLEPLTFPKTSISTADFNRQRLAWFQRLLIPPLEKEFEGTLAAPARRALVDKLLEDVARVDFSVMADPQATEAFVRELDDLVAPSARMPVFQALAANYLSSARRSPAAAVRARMTYENLDPDTQPGVLGLMAIIALLETRTISIDSPELGAKAKRFLEAAISSAQCPEGDVPFLVDVLVQPRLIGIQKAQWATLTDFYRASKLPEWARETLAGAVEVRLAWNARGSGFANTVNQEGWKGFREHMEKAVPALTAGWKLRPDRPEAASAMVEVAMAGHAPEGQTMRTWFDRATAAQFDHMQSYDKFRQGLLPRWGGDPVELLAFGVACARVDKPGSFISEQLTMALQAVALDSSEWRPLFREPRIARALLESREANVRVARNAYERNEQNGMLAAEAYLCGQYEIAGAALAKFEGFDKENFRLPLWSNDMLQRLRLNREDFILDCRLRGGPMKKEYLSILEAREKGDTTRALDETTAMLKAHNATSDEILKGFRFILRCENQLAKDGKAVLPFAAYAWAVTHGTWHRNPPAMSVASLYRPTASHFRGHLGERYEVRGKVILPANRANVTFGLTVGCTNTYETDGYAFFAGFRGDKPTGFVFSDPLGRDSHQIDPPEAWTPPKDATPIEVRAIRDRDTFSVWLDGKLVLDKKLPADLPSGAMSFGLMSRGGTEDDRLTFRDFEVLKLKEEK